MSKNELYDEIETFFENGGTLTQLFEVLKWYFELENYKDWRIIQIIEESEVDMALIMKEIEPMKKEVYLSEATNQELIDELIKRLESQV